MYFLYYILCDLPRDMLHARTVYATYGKSIATVIIKLFSPPSNKHRYEILTRSPTTKMFDTVGLLIFLIFMQHLAISRKWNWYGLTFAAYFNIFYV